MSVSISGDGSLTGIDQGFNIVGVLTASGGLAVSAGSTSAPSISPTGDSNTGIFFPSADTIAFGEGGVEAARFDSNGRLGIGVTNPFQKLHLESTTSPLTLNLKLNKSSTTSDYAEITFQLWEGATSGETVFGGSGTSRPSGVIRCLNENGGTAAGSLIFGTFTGGSTNSTVTEKVRISSGGNLGVGTNNPYGKTHIEVNAAAGAGSGNACALWLKNANQTANNSATIFAGNDSSAACAAINFVHANYSNNQGFISFDTRENALTYNSNAFKIDAYGRVTAPYQPCFLANRGSAQSPYSQYNAIIFNNEVYDQGSNFNSSTGIFTAPVTGKYLFLATVLVQSSSNGNEYDFILITSNRDYYGSPGRTETQAGTSWGDGYIAHGVQAIADMDANDTAYITYSTFGGGAIYGGGGNWTRFSGYLLC